MYLEEMSNVSQELPMTRLVLENAGLVEGHRRGKFVYYDSVAESPYSGRQDRL